MPSGDPSAIPPVYPGPRASLHISESLGESQIKKYDLVRLCESLWCKTVHAQSQQYLTPYEEDALVHFLLQMSDLGQPVRIKFIRFLALCVTRQRPETDRPLKPPGKNWARGFEIRYPEKHARKVKAVDWNRHEKNTYWKMAHWFEVIGGCCETRLSQRRMYTTWTRQASCY
jgi:hypothetical protein